MTRVLSRWDRIAHPYQVPSQPVRLRVMTHVQGMDPSGTRRKRDPKGTRERLVRAALELFTTQGYHASTTPQIAARAGIAEGTIYRHFESKEHLLNEIYRAALRLLIRAVKDSGQSHSCHDRLFGVARSWLELARRSPPLIKLVFGSDLTGLLDAKSRDTRREFRLELEKVIAAGKSEGEIRAGSVEVWTDVWLQLVILVLDRTAAGDWPPHHAAPEQVLQSAWDAVRVG
jgi:AcrR family transcriptional regulator